MLERKRISGSISPAFAITAHQNPYNLRSGGISGVFVPEQDRN